MIDRERHAGILDAYRTVDQIYADLDTIGATYPSIVELVDYGDSYCKTLGGCVTLGGDPSAFALAKAREAFLELDSAYSKTSGNGTVDSVRAARDQLYAKLRG